MILTVLAAFVAGASQPAPAPVTLARKFGQGEKLAYAVTASIHAETRAGNLDTWIPDNVDLSYGFTTVVKKLKADGIAEILYNRPTFTEVQDEDFDSGPKKTVDKINMQALLTLSPINQILEAKDLSKTKASDDSTRWLAHAVRGAKQRGLAGNFIGELHRLALFVGGFDSALDFNPKLPLDPVSVGDTWKQTVSYQPQKLKGDKEGKQEVQRLDYTFTYKGLMNSEGKQVQRVQAQLNLDTDLAAFFNQLVKMKADESGLKKIPMTLKATIDFDLDPKTFRTIRATASSTGGFSIWLTEEPDRALVEEKFRGNTTEELVGSAIVKS
jgi:hypothetical protein